MQAIARRSPAAAPKGTLPLAERQQVWVHHQLSQLDAELLGSLGPGVDATLRQHGHAPSRPLAPHDSAREVHAGLA